MRDTGRKALVGAALLLASWLICQSAEAAGVEVLYPESAETPVLSLREIWPEFADQDPTPLVRVYGDGRVVVHLPVYMKRNGVFEMWLPKTELEALLAEVTPILIAFEEGDVRDLRAEAEALRRAQAEAAGEPTLFHVADAEVSLFRLAVDSYRAPGTSGAAALPPIERVWRGLLYDAERYPDIEPIQALMRAEQTLRALTEREELTWVAPATP